jgi:hypothetical protein
MIIRKPARLDATVGGKLTISPGRLPVFVLNSCLFIVYSLDL